MYVSVCIVVVSAGCHRVQGVVSLVYLSSSDMYKLINYSSFVNWLAVGLSVVALLYFRWKRPDAPRPIKVFLLDCLMLRDQQN